MKFIEQGIVYDELSEEDKETYEATFEDQFIRVKYLDF